MKFKKLFASILVLGFFLIPSYAGAQVPIFKDVCRHNAQEGNPDPTVCQDARQGQNTNPLYGPNGVITSVVNILSLVVGIAAVAGIIVAAIKFLTSGSNPEDANKARELVIYAIVGLILATAAQLIVRVVLYNELYP